MAWVLLWSCCGIPAFAAGLLQGVPRLLPYGCGVPVGLIWNLPVPLLVIAVISLWYCCVIPVGLLGYSWGIVGGSLWYYFGIAVGMLWYCCDIAMGFLWVALRILGSLWLLDCYGKVLKRWWDNFINLARFPFHAKTGLFSTFFSTFFRVWFLIVFWRKREPQGYPIWLKNR